ncbi:MAG: ComEA family DNA-binding protein [bacterium]|nr:ComEA family DNA-binding protein [bacterium]
MKTQSILSGITIIVLLAIAIIGGITLINTRPAPVEIVINPPPATATPSPTNTPAPIMVYVTGAVINPETTVSLPAGSRVEDAITQAGGFADNADKTGVNLAEILRDGVQVHVPIIGIAEATSDTPDSVVIATPIQPTVIYINRATIEELMTLPNIGQVTAERIIAYRTENGNFNSMADLDNVDGIGASTLARLEGLISFEP